MVCSFLFGFMRHICSSFTIVLLVCFDYFDFLVFVCGRLLHFGFLKISTFVCVNFCLCFHLEREKHEVLIFIAFTDPFQFIFSWFNFDMSYVPRNVSVSSSFRCFLITHIQITQIARLYGTPEVTQHHWLERGLEKQEAEEWKSLKTYKFSSSFHCPVTSC